MIQIQFLDNDIINALVPAFSMKPDKIYFLYDTEDISKEQTENIKKAIGRRLPDIKQVYCEVDRYKFSEVKKKLEEIVSENTENGEENEIIYDITGGTEIMTACGMMMCDKHGGRAVYMKRSVGDVFDIYEGKKTCDIVNLDVDDYLTAIGAKRLDSSHTVPEERDFERILNVAEEIFRNENAWHALCNYLCETPLSEKFGIRRQLPYNGSRYGVSSLTTCFVENGFLIKGDGFYSFADDHSKEYMTNYGIWLEMFVYIKAFDCFDSVYLGELIDWDSDEEKDNEIDVMGVKDSVLYFISCKMRKPEAKDLYEVVYLAKKLGGKQAKGIIATTYDVESEKLYPNGIYRRFEKMKIGWVTPRQINNLRDLL